MASKTRAKSSTERAIGPILSIDQASDMQPVRLTRPNVGRRPEAPQARQGETMLPSVSLPRANADQAGGHRRRRAGGRATRAGARVPRAAGHAAEPEVALRQGAERELGHEHRAGFLQSRGDGGLLVDHPVLVLRDTPGGGISRVGDQVLGPPGHSVQRTAVDARPRARRPPVPPA